MDDLVFWLLSPSHKKLKELAPGQLHNVKLLNAYTMFKILKLLS